MCNYRIAMRCCLTFINSSTLETGHLSPLPEATSTKISMRLHNLFRWRMCTRYAPTGINGFCLPRINWGNYRPGQMNCTCGRDFQAVQVPYLSTYPLGPHSSRDSKLAERNLSCYVSLPLIKFSNLCLSSEQISSSLMHLNYTHIHTLWICIWTGWYIRELFYTSCLYFRKLYVIIILVLLTTILNGTINKTYG